MYVIPTHLFDDGGFPVVIEKPVPANAWRWTVRWGATGRSAQSFGTDAAAFAFAARTFTP